MSPNIQPRLGSATDEAFPWDTAPRYLLRDRDTSYGPAFRNRVQAMGIEEIVTAPRSPIDRPMSKFQPRSSVAHFQRQTPSTFFEQEQAPNLMSSLRSVEFKNGGVEEIAAALIGMVLAKRSFIPDPEGRALAMIQRIADPDIRVLFLAHLALRKSTHRDPALGDPNDC